jgi:hypothetical protein
MMAPFFDVYKPTLIRAIATFSSSSTRYVIVSGTKYASLTGCVQFDLVDKKELAPLDELNEAILAEDKTR